MIAAASPHSSPASDIGVMRAGVAASCRAMDEAFDRIARVSTAHVHGLAHEPRETAAAPCGDGRACQECGGPVAHAEARFCAVACRDAFNNRRKARGAVLYDLFMTHRHERALARVMKVLRAMNRLAAEWRAEDVARRAGRPSWQPARDAIGQRPYLVADRGARLTHGRRR